MAIFRLETLHPSLVHGTIGALPIIVVAYAMAAWRRSSAWTFAGDVAVVTAAAVTLAAAAFGLVSNAIVPWPGGLELWRWLHLGLGIASTVLLGAFAAARLVLRKRQPGTGPRTCAAALAVTFVVAATGWIGGEVLVFRGGMAVTAAGDGALAPPVYPAGSPPRDFLDAMRKVRASWAVTTSQVAWMLVHEPRDERYAAVRREAERIAQLADWMSGEGASTLRDGSKPSAPHADGQHAALISRAEHMAIMAETLSGDADDIAQAAAKKDLAGLSRAVGEMGSLCADCHQELRWH